MELNLIIKKIYKKSIFLLIIFILILAVYFFLLNFYSQKIIKKINDLNQLKSALNEKKIQAFRDIEFKKINEYLKQKTGKDVDKINQIFKDKINMPLEDLSKKINEEANSFKGKIIRNELVNQNVIALIEVPVSNFEQFYDFFIKNGLFIRLQEMKINKRDNNLLIELTIR